MRILSRIGRLGLLAVAAVLMMPALPVGVETLSEDELTSLLENAATREDHLNLASHYSSQAEELRNDSSRHERMARRYRNVPPILRATGRHMIKHCERLAATLSEAAKAADELASGHREMAGEVK